MKKTILVAGLGLLLLGAGFVWGFLSHRSAIFPHSLLVRLGLATGILTPVSPRVPGGGEADALAGLSYVDGTFDAASDESSVLLHREGATSPGLNFYGSRKTSACRLIDMEGAVVHEWTYPSGTWEHTELLPNGDVLATILDTRLLKLDVDSNVVWVVDGRFHHDLCVLPDDSILALTRAAVLIPEVHPTIKTLDDRLLLLTMEGEVRREVSLTEVFLRSPYAFLVPTLAHRQITDADRDGDSLELDVLHANHIEVFDGSLADVSPLFARGNALISLRNINTIAILDSGFTKVLWVWGASNLTHQHHPVLLPNGRILLFDNGTEESRVLEVDPLGRRVEWVYENGKNFFSRTRGSVQRLENGNTLITESDRGYVLEVTPAGEVVWRFANPHVLEGGVRVAIWRMTRFTPSELPFLEELGVR